MEYLADSLRRKVIFFTGKGGVGKSTLAWATALACHRKGKKTAVIGWQPVHKENAQPVEESLGITWMGLETLSCFREYALQIIRFQKLYDTVLDNKILRTFVLAAPGLADAVVAGKIWDLYEHSDYDLLVVDMPSTGHARSFFKSPLGLQKIFKVGFVARDTERVCALFRAPNVRLDLIALPEELPIVECRELKASLAPLHPFPFGFLHINQFLPDWLHTSDETLSRLGPAAGKVFEDFNAQRTEQLETLQLAKEIGMPQIHVPRFAVDSWKENIEQVSHALEKL